VALFIFFFITQKYKFIFFNKKNNFLLPVTKIMKKKSTRARDIRKNIKTCKNQRDSGMETCVSLFACNKIIARHFFFILMLQFFFLRKIFQIYRKKKLFLNVFWLKIDFFDTKIKMPQTIQILIAPRKHAHFPVSL